MKKMTLTVAALLSSGVAFADLTTVPVTPGIFDGGYISVGLGGANTDVITETNQETGNTTTTSYSGVAVPVTVGFSKKIAYGINIDGNIFAPLNFGQYRLYGNTTQEYGALGVAFEPGYYIASNILLYAKVSYVSGLFAYGISGVQNNETYIPGSHNTTFNSGIGWGVGGKYAINQHWFAGGELQVIHFGQSTVSNGSVSPTSFTQTMGSANVGYLF